ncbi:mitotic spindle assembly checkpoint protein MAD1 [Clonorchis sinensis]|uniref:Mitotic spindle assembly checkpoint protein MAD1 n=1 Tax=Clonorchis sinensis TaxID=79923 RepID=G7YV92_CLOSI|nr:mitotic spindle assembly checkpoint protein MAD1 [Clonorchis sinensis]
MRFTVLDVGHGTPPCMVRMAALRVPKEDSSVHQLRQVSVAEEYRADLARKLLETHSHVEDEDCLEDGWRRVKEAMLSAFRTACPAHLIRLNEHWISSRSADLIAARKRWRGPGKQSDNHTAENLQLKQNTSLFFRNNRHCLAEWYTSLNPISVIAIGCRQRCVAFESVASGKNLGLMLRTLSRTLLIDKRDLTVNQWSTELEQLRAESVDARRLQMELEREKAESDAKVTKLSALLDGRSKRLQELEAFVTERKSELDEYKELKLAVQDLQTQKKSLEDRLKLEEKRLPVNEHIHSSLKSSGYLAKLELEHNRVKSAYKSLSKERADWLITKEENRDLRAQVEQLKVWRERALNAENALAEKQDLNTSGPVSPGRIQRLERENQLLLAEQGELRTEATQLRHQLEETNTRLQCLASQRTQVAGVPQSFTEPCNWDRPQLLETPIQRVPEISHQAEREIVVELRYFKIPPAYFDLRIGQQDGMSDEIVLMNRAPTLIAFANGGFEPLQIVAITLVSFSRRVAELENRLSETETAKLALEEKLEIFESQGSYDPRVTTVVTLKANPMSTLKTNLSNELAHLRHENERFRQRIKVLEDCVSRLREAKAKSSNQLVANEPTVGLSGVTMVVNERLQENPDPLSELAEVREQLRVERLRSDRLMEMFDKASTKFRSACRELLGYRIDMNTADEYKVRSAFVSDPKEYILFKRVNGKFELQATDYSCTLPNDVRSYLNTNNGTAGFFAALTMFYLQQNTMLI